MTDKELKGDMPDYSGQLQVSAWIKKDKIGKSFMSFKIGIYANLFINEQ